MFAGGCRENMSLGRSRARIHRLNLQTWWRWKLASSFSTALRSDCVLCVCAVCRLCWPVPLSYGVVRFVLSTPGTDYLVQHSHIAKILNIGYHVSRFAYISRFVTIYIPYYCSPRIRYTPAYDTNKRYNDSKLWITWYTNERSKNNQTKWK